MKRHHSLFSATGIPSLFLIFAVLMLVILSLLGYGTARQDLRASILSLEQTAAYYSGCENATSFYTETVHSLKSYQTQAKNEEEYFNLADAYFSSQPDVVWDAASHQAQYKKAISDTQSLLVELIVSYPDKDSDPVRITAWNTIVTADWKPDASQSVYKGEAN